MPPPAPLRPLTLADSHALWELDQKCFPPGIAYSAAEIRELLRQGARGLHAGSWADGALAGFILTLHHRGRGHVITLDVAAGHRRQGLGQALMAAAETHYRASGTAGMRLEVDVANAAALRFYAGLGYRAIRTLPGYYGRGQDGLLLHKTWRRAIR